MAPVAPAFLSLIAIAAIAAIAMGDGEIVTRESACRSYGKRKRGSWGKSRPSILDLGADGGKAARYDSVTWNLQRVIMRCTSIQSVTTNLWGQSLGC